MALITLGAMVTDITGTIGGTTFQNTKAGLIARNKPMARKSATPAQSLARQFPNRFIGLWQALTWAQQLSWNVYASAHPHVNRFGETKLWSGFQCFESTNYNLIRAGADYTEAPPVYVAPPAVGDFTVTIAADDIQITFESGDTPDSTTMLIWASYIVGSAYTSNRSRYRFIKQTDYVGGAVDYALGTEWMEIFGFTLASIPVGQLVKIIVGVQNVHLGSGVATAILFNVGEYTGV